MLMNINDIKQNSNNPRIIKDDKFKKLVASIKEFPEMLEVREIVINKDNIILGGNMRYRAAKEAGLIEIPVKIVNWDEYKQRQFIIKDNVSGGEWDWDLLANEWDAIDLDNWGIDKVVFDEIDFDNISSNEDRTASDKNQNVTCPDCGKMFEV